MDKSKSKYDNKLGQVLSSVIISVLYYRSLLKEKIIQKFDQLNRTDEDDNYYYDFNDENFNLIRILKS